MATYVTADIHGQYSKFINLLEKIHLTDNDTLYVLGDVIDRGPGSIKTRQKRVEMPNAICLVGNHELMALDCLDFLMSEITDESITKLDAKMQDNLLCWFRNGGMETLKEFRVLNTEEKADIIDYINEMQVYEELTVAGKEYLLVHAGLGNYYPGKDIDEYSLYELVWVGAEYDIQYFPDKYVITGHTPTQYIAGNPRPGYIYRLNNHIALDCGACHKDGRLAAICLDTGEEYYSDI